MVSKLWHFIIIVVALSSSSCVHAPTPAEQAAQIERATGLRPLVLEPGLEPVLTKEHRGYPVLVRFRMGDVWGRYAARVVAGEVGREVGSIIAFLTGSTRSGVGSVVGSPFDRMLSRAIGQPMSIIATVRHGKKNASRLDIYNSAATIRPEESLPAVQQIGMSAGTMYAVDRALASRILSDKALLETIANYRSQYVRVDEVAVSFLFAASENEYSGMIRNFGSYDAMLLGILDGLVGIADHLEG